MGSLAKKKLSVNGCVENWLAILGLLHSIARADTVEVLTIQLPLIIIKRSK